MDIKQAVLLLSAIAALAGCSDGGDSSSNATATSSSSKAIDEAAYCQSLVTELGKPDSGYTASYDAGICTVTISSFNNDKMVRYLDGATGCVSLGNYCEGTFSYSKDGRWILTLSYDANDAATFKVSTKGLDCRDLPGVIGVIAEDSLWHASGSLCALDNGSGAVAKASMLARKDSLLGGLGWTLQTDSCDRAYTCFSFRKTVNGTDFCLDYGYDMEKQYLSGAEFGVCAGQDASSSSSGGTLVAESSASVETGSSSSVGGILVQESSAATAKSSSSSAAEAGSSAAATSSSVTATSSSVTEPSSSAAESSSSIAKSSSSKANWAYLNPAISYGEFTDKRDGQVYKSVVIGTQTWMAENLNYATDSSWCYKDSAYYCTQYGRWYQWAAAIGVSALYDSTTLGSNIQRQGLCPEGWHVPDTAEIQILATTVGGISVAGAKLASISGWKTSSTDSFGFSIVGWNNGENFTAWLATEIDETRAYNVGAASNVTKLYIDTYNLKASKKPIRCVKD